MSTPTHCKYCDGSGDMFGGFACDECGGAGVYTPTRTEFEAAAYRWMTSASPSEIADMFVDSIYCEAKNRQLYLEERIAAAMGWPTVPEVKS